MSSFYGTARTYEWMCEGDNQHNATYKMFSDIFLMVYNTHRPADEEHSDGSDQWYVSNQGLQDHAQLPVELQEVDARWTL